MYVLSIQLNSSSEKKKKDNFAFLQMNDGLISRKVKINLDKTGTLPDTKI